MTSDIQVQQMLDQIDQQCEVLAGAVLAGQAEALETQSLSLKDSAMSLSDFLSDASVDESIRVFTKKRLTQIAQTLSSARAGLARRHAVVERTLNAVVPSTESMTYGAAIKPYGAPVRQSGTLRSYSA